MRSKLRHPIRAIREPFGTAGLIVACVALIAALGGSAIAANNALTSKQKKEVKKIAKQFAGKPGAPGASGPAGQPGIQGPKGDAGAAGSNGADGTDGSKGATGATGTNGTNGESVNVIPLPNGDANCEKGGAKIINDAGTEEAFACNGTSGDGGEYPKTLPTGYTDTGFWEVQGESGLVVGEAIEVAQATVDFTLPLENPPAETLLINGSSGEAEKDKCPGTVDNPEAAAEGVLCVYEKFGGTSLFAALPQKFGVILWFNKTDQGFGSWAVKAG